MVENEVRASSTSMATPDNDRTVSHMIISGDGVPCRRSGNNLRNQAPHASVIRGMESWLIWFLILDCS